MLQRWQSPDAQLIVRHRSVELQNHWRRGGYTITTLRGMARPLPNFTTACLHRCNFHSPASLPPPSFSPHLTVFLCLGSLMRPFPCFQLPLPYYLSLQLARISRLVDHVTPSPAPTNTRAHAIKCTFHRPQKAGCRAASR